MASIVLGIAGEKVSTFTSLNFDYAHRNDKSKISKPYDLTLYDNLKIFRNDIRACLKDDSLIAIACDMHPDLLSSRYAEILSQDMNIPLFRIRHHHAHIAAVLAEHDLLEEPCLGLALDGYGFGEEEEAWGGELLYVNGTSYKRIGRLKPIRLVGQDAATINTKRLKAAFLYDHLGENKVKELIPDISPIFLQMLKHNVNCTICSSTGRLFDIACELGKIKGEDSLSRIANFEQLASNPQIQNDGYTISKNKNLVEADISPLLLQAHGFSQRDFANFFHGTLAKTLSEMTKQAAAPDVKYIVLSGGCILNKPLTNSLKKELSNIGFTVLQHINLSPSDTSVSFGMAHLGRLKFQQTKKR